jgi:hypothetical protein
MGRLLILRCWMCVRVGCSNVGNGMSVCRRFRACLGLRRYAARSAPVIAREEFHEYSFWR